MVGDLNRDGQADVLWRNTSTGWTLVWFMSGSQIFTSQWVYQVTDANWQMY